MPIFAYRGTDPIGRETKGTVSGANLEAVLQDLTRRGYTIEALAPEGQEIPVYAPDYRPNPEQGTYEHPVHQASPHLDMRRPAVVTEVLGPIFGKVPLATMSQFYRQFATMLNAGVGPHDALENFARHARDIRLKKVLVELQEQVLHGRPISYGMQRYPEVFGVLEISMVRAGEAGGFVDSSLSNIADYLDREIALRNLKRRVTFYPKLTLVMSVLIFGGANMIIGSLAPGSPIRLNNPLSDPKTWVWLGPLVIGIFLFLRVGLHNPRVKYFWDGVVRLVPFIGKTNVMFSMARFGRSFGALYRSGVPVSQAVQLAADACGNEYIRSRMSNAAEKLSSGAPITQTMAETGVVTPTVLEMLSTGERTGMIDPMLNKMADYYEGEGEVRATQMGYVLGVVMLLIVGIYVGYLLLTGYSGIANSRMSGIEP